jgi:hypothetical protein
VTSAESSSPPTLFRFSLLTLLSVMTLAGFTSAIVFSPQWDADERLLLAFWCAGLILGVSIGRFRGNSGVISGGLGAVVGCLVATYLLLERSYARQLTAWDGQPITPYLAFIVCVGWFAAILATLAYRAVATGWLERIWLNKRVRRVLLGVVGSLVSLLIITQLFQEPRWQPAWEVDLRMRSWQPDPVFQISPRGDFLFTHADDENDFDPTSERSDSLFHYTPRGVVSRELSESIDQPHLALSPDGKWLAAGTSCYLSLFDLATGKNASVWKLKDIERFVQLQFNPAGELLVTTRSPRIQRCYVMDVTADPLPQPQLFPFSGAIFLDPTGEVLLKLHEAEDETLNWSIDLVRRSDEASLGHIRDVPAPAAFSISPGGKFVAFGSRVWKLGGSTLDVAGVVVGFTADQRAIVMHQRDIKTPPKWIPAWLITMPFARHLHPQQITGELRLVDLDTNKIVARTARFANMVIASPAQQGKSVVGVSGSHFRVWNVPPRK